MNEETPQKDEFTPEQVKLIEDLSGIMLYPQDTEGSRMAYEVRQKCNSLSTEERQRLLDEAMRIIKEGPTNE